MNLKWNGEQFLRAIESEEKEAMSGLSTLISSDMKNQIQTSNNPSTPGTPPNTKTGKLRDSINVINEDKEIKIKMPEYAAYLEQGTKRMSPRPFIRTTIEQNKLRYVEHLNSILKRVTQ